MLGGFLRGLTFWPQLFSHKGSPLFFNPVLFVVDDPIKVMWGRRGWWGEANLKFFFFLKNTCRAKQHT